MSKAGGLTDSSSKQVNNLPKKYNITSEEMGKFLKSVKGDLNRKPFIRQIDTMLAEGKKNLDRRVNSKESRDGNKPKDTSNSDGWFSFPKILIVCGSIFGIYEALGYCKNFVTKIMSFNLYTEYYKNLNKGLNAYEKTLAETKDGCTKNGINDITLKIRDEFYPGENLKEIRDLAEKTKSIMRCVDTNCKIEAAIGVLNGGYNLQINTTAISEANKIYCKEAINSLASGNLKLDINKDLDKKYLRITDLLDVKKNIETSLNEFVSEHKIDEKDQTFVEKLTEDTIDAANVVADGVHKVGDAVKAVGQTATFFGTAAAYLNNGLKFLFGEGVKK